MNAILMRQLKLHHKYQLPMKEQGIMKILSSNHMLFDIKKIRDKDAHIAFRNALIDYFWEMFSNSDM
ncbi:hypothetical protein ACS0TY_023911 [Phlomoides rotata]